MPNKNDDTTNPTNDKNKKPEFKPGDTTMLQFGKEILNGNVEWRNALLELLRYSDDTLESVMSVLECSQEALLLILNSGDSSLLDFKQGARLLMLHDAAIHSEKRKQAAAQEQE